MADTPSKSGQYELEVTDFGPIARAKVELRPLTVFVGPAHTGKSYLATLVYALHKTFGEHFMRRWSPALLAFDSRPDELDALLKERSRQENVVEEPGAMPAPLQAVFQSAFQGEDLPTRTQLLKEEIHRCFSIAKLRELVREDGQASEETRVALRLFTTREPLQLEYKIFPDDTPEIQGGIPASALQELWHAIEKEKVPGLSSLFTQEQVPDTQDTEKQAPLRQAFALITGKILGPIRRSIFYLPASRTGVMQSHQVLVSSLIHRATTAGLRPSESIPMLPGTLGDFLLHLVETGQGRTARFLRRDYSEGDEKNRIRQLAQEMERDILQGTVRVATSGIQYPLFQYIPEHWPEDGTPIPLMRASSMVSELAPIVLYLRHLVRPGDTLIVEEPESHLHPAAQAKLARHLVKMMQAGVRIIITTHSDWMLEQFINLVNLSDLPPEQRKGLEVADLALERKDFGAWIFAPQEKAGGTVVEELQIGSQGSSLPPDYSKVTEHLYNEWAEIYDRLARLSNK